MTNGWSGSFTRSKRSSYTNRHVRLFSLGLIRLHEQVASWYFPATPQCNAATVVHERTRWNMKHSYALMLCRRAVTDQRVRSVFERLSLLVMMAIVLLKVVLTQVWKLNSKSPLPQGLLTQPGPRI